MIQGRVDAGQERIVLEALNDRRIFGLRDVAQIAARRKIPERIERHERLSRR